jgi:hypothetical protein
MLPPLDLDSLWEDLFVSVLSVNQYSLERTYAALPLLRGSGLLSPENLCKFELGEIISRLKAADCDRGKFMTNLFATRLSNLGMMIESRGIAQCRRILSSNDPAAIRSLLLPVNGIGPKVLANFFMLRGIKEN